MIPFYSAPIESGTSISQFCSVVVPVYFFYLLMLYAFGEKLAQHLIKADRFSENRFIIRPFSIVGTVFTPCFFAFSAGYFLLFKVFHLAAFFGFALFGYLWVKVNTYCVRGSYTDDTLFYQAWRKKKEIPFSGIHRICWESGRHSVSYMLVIYCHNGNRYSFSSRDFAGLARLKRTYEDQCCRQDNDL